MTPLANPAQMIKMIEKGAPRVIHTEEELDHYAKALFRLTAKEDPTASELQAIELLTMLLEQYEDRMHPIPSATPIEILRYLMDKHSSSRKISSPNSAPNRTSPRSSAVPATLPCRTSTPWPPASASPPQPSSNRRTRITCAPLRNNT